MRCFKVPRTPARSISVWICDTRAAEIPARLATAANGWFAARRNKYTAALKASAWFLFSISPCGSRAGHDRPDHCAHHHRSNQLRGRSGTGRQGAAAYALRLCRRSAAVRCSSCGLGIKLGEIICQRIERQSEPDCAFRRVRLNQTRLKQRSKQRIRRA